jgi:ketosteroid isomerase-like protein
MRISLATAGLLCALTFGVRAQDGLVGTWQGTLMAGPNTLRIGLVVTRDAGQDRATLVSIDQDGARIPVQRVTVDGTAVHLDVSGVNGRYDGVLSPDGRALSGTWSQGPASQALSFARVEKLDPPPTFGEPEKAAVVATVNSYFQSFTAKDWTRFGECFRPPYVMWNVGSSPVSFGTVDEIVTRYKGVRTPLDATAYALTRAAQVIVRPLSPTAVLAEVHWRRDKKDGSLFQEGAETLALVKTPGGWKITGNLAERLSHYDKVF